MFAGLRLGEALALRWSDIDLHRNTLQITDSKTDAGVRTVNLLPLLANELRVYQLGHTTAGLTLALYAREMHRRDGEPARLRALAGHTDEAD